MANSAPVFLSLPDWRHYTLMPPSDPQSMPPPSFPASVMHPFNIPDSIYHAALDGRTVATMAITYAVTVKLLNRYNLSRNKKPWAISQNRIFPKFVIVHNFFLAVYSAWTFWGMLSAMTRTVYNPFGPLGPAATVDSICHLQGKPGLGNSVFYDDASQVWQSYSPDGGLATAELDNVQMGRLWNEGLGYFGWIFYVSKFYEVLDTFIILAKGKPSSTLQTYHHTGAMLCMWAGIRYMAAPIWVFVQFNSFIHALMYAYYVVSAFNVRVPVFIKRGLTSLQISQFLIGGSLAGMHAFVSYILPISTISSSSSEPSPAAEQSGALDSIKQLVLGNSSYFNGQHNVHIDYTVRTCLNTTGEHFGVWLNMGYLAPLTYLFVSFFIASYVKRSNVAQKPNNVKSAVQTNIVLAEKAGWDAAKKVECQM